MCAITHYRQKYCKHRWGIITEPCAFGMGFDSCPMIFNREYVLPKPDVFVTRTLPCPKCDLHGFYDRNQIRMVPRVRTVLKIGSGPGREDRGVEIPLCCVVM
ncbi:hypothetical protein QBC34DRAFT_378342 [Podospora aff. communis PSN243]|uniref:Uncharacterized protein n=1 Tax=Podospora aff. communis PSN243 TaxID=3040156 RepID=A0AAV9GUQ5_9PEZI|nr:hypothetical protein QBC34DRAFT_378342 [Podospora aff. communis PSN243]